MKTSLWIAALTIATAAACSTEKNQDSKPNGYILDDSEARTSFDANFYRLGNSYKIMNGITMNKLEGIIDDDTRIGIAKNFDQSIVLNDDGRPLVILAGKRSAGSQGVLNRTMDTYVKMSLGEPIFNPIFGDCNAGITFPLLLDNQQVGTIFTGLAFTRRSKSCEETIKIEEGKATLLDPTAESISIGYATVCEDEVADKCDLSLKKTVNALGDIEVVGLEIKLK